ncbi:NACHT domain-containing protein [Lysobacter sp. Hz 25]|uniref:NACHT domain-containing protein n=1 Tax=Lysobacter sp. Hz 25 TaxID=3383698 RepID=UPI0038D41A74
MVTTSTRLDKIKGDVKKLGASERIELQVAPSVAKWIVTEKQLDAEHIEYARKQQVSVLSFDLFQRRFFDSGKYVVRRSKVAFGSARDPITDSVNISEGAYIDLPMMVAYDPEAKDKAFPYAISLEQIIARLVDGSTVVLLAPFGSGKSLTTRELFLRMSRQIGGASSSPTPICLNMREHWGEDYSDEILDRHARIIGYEPRNDLVAAWRAGMCCALIDGFDELASQTVVRLDNSSFMREARRSALKGLRDFTQKLPRGAGVFICGRDHYFDTMAELHSSLGIQAGGCLIVRLGEFNEGSAEQFLSRNGVNKHLPDWLPRKPLLLSYLLRNDLFDDILDIDANVGFGYSWDVFLERITGREALLESSSMEAETVRAVLERLAEDVRAKVSGTGPITGNDLANAYATETGQGAGEGVLAQLQRLPGLTERESDPGARSFVDADMLGALQGGAFVRHVLTGYVTHASAPIAELSEKAISMAIYLLQKNDAGPDVLIGLAHSLSNRGSTGTIFHQAIADCCYVAIMMAISESRSAIDFRGLTVESGAWGEIPLDEIDVRGLKIKDSMIRQVNLGRSSGEVGISFYSCMIDRVVGVASEAGLPRNVISADCQITSYEQMSTSSAILQMSISPQMKALITVLRKIYKQAGSGRKIAALSRGITRPDVLKYIVPVTHILAQHNFVSIYNHIVHPVRRQASRVERILAAPSVADDPVLKDVAELV